MGGLGEALAAIGAGAAGAGAAGGNFFVDAANSIGDFAKSAWNQGTSLDKGLKDVVVHDIAESAVVSETPDGLVNVTEFKGPDGTIQYIGDIQGDIDWSQTLGNLTGEAAKQIVKRQLNKSGLGQIIAGSGELIDAFDTGAPSDKVIHSLVGKKNIGS